MKAFPHLPDAHWECPCGREKPRRGQTTTPVKTIVSVTQFHCPWCGREYREEYRVPPRDEIPARIVERTWEIDGEYLVEVFHVPPRRKEST